MSQLRQNPERLPVASLPGAAAGGATGGGGGGGGDASASSPVPSARVRTDAASALSPQRFADPAAAGVDHLDAGVATPHPPLHLRSASVDADTVPSLPNHFVAFIKFYYPLDVA